MIVNASRDEITGLPDDGFFGVNVQWLPGRESANIGLIRVIDEKASISE
jgi:hypothetical protein